MLLMIKTIPILCNTPNNLTVWKASRIVLSVVIALIIFPKMAKKNPKRYKVTPRLIALMMVF
ncbi:hypothetical protein D3C85_1230300 [compost metagenome]